MLFATIMIGFVTGVLSGLLGIGGGAFLIVLGVSILGLGQHAAQAAAIASTVPIVLVGAINLHRRGLVNYRLAALLVFGVAAGGVLGSYIANNTSELVLRRIFSLVFAMTSIHMFWAEWKKKQKAARKDKTELY